MKKYKKYNRHKKYKLKKKHKPKIKGCSIFGQTLKNFETLWYRWSRWKMRRKKKIMQW